LIDYSFDAGESVIKDHAKGQPADLVIPRRFKPYKRAFLEMPFSLKEIWRNIGDILINLFGFIPFGFLLSESLNRRHWSMKSAMFLSVMLGFIISLTIEILQAYLPTRDSSMSDLIANTVGSGIGSIAYACLPQVIIQSRRVANILSST
jgi:glycopeptide antibiotics resistance protein